MKRKNWNYSVFSILLFFALSACGGGENNSTSSVNNTVSTDTSTTTDAINNNPIGPIAPGTPYASEVDRAFAIAAGIIARQQTNGVWMFDNEGTLTTKTDAYSGQAGILLFLARLYQSKPHPDIKKSMLAGANWLRAQKIENAGPGLYTGQAGIAYAYLELAHSLQEPVWLEAAIAIAERLETDQTQLATAPADMISGHVSNGLFFLKLYQHTQQPRWLQAAKNKADESLSKAVRSGAGIKFETAISATDKRIYTGFAHGAAGVGYFYLRLSQSLGISGQAYKNAALDIAAWLRSIAIRNPDGINWYRREPDQMNQQINQWCHGAPGIGLFFAKLYEITQDAQDLALAKEAAATTLRLGHTGSSLCHGTTGNAQLYLKLHALTGDATYLQAAREVGSKLWASWDQHFHYPSWMGEDGSQRYHNASLMTGNAGRAYYYLQLSNPQQFPTPFLE